MEITNETKRIALFLIGCMGARLLLVWLTYTEWTRLYMSIFCVIVAIGFTYIYVTGARQTGPEVFGDKIWWNYLRPVHATLYLTTALMIWSETYASSAWMVLLLDVFVGLTAFVHQHFLL